MHITEATLSHLDKAYEVEDGHGQQRDPYLKEMNIRTYLVIDPRVRGLGHSGLWHTQGEGPEGRVGQRPACGGGELPVTTYNANFLGPQCSSTGKWAEPAGLSKALTAVGHVLKTLEGRPHEFIFHVVVTPLPVFQRHILKTHSETQESREWPRGPGPPCVLGSNWWHGPARSMPPLSSAPRGGRGPGAAPSPPRVRPGRPACPGAAGESSLGLAQECRPRRLFEFPLPPALALAILRAGLPACLPQPLSPFPSPRPHPEDHQVLSESVSCRV